MQRGARALSVDIESKVVVDTRLLHTKLPVQFDLDFPGLSCEEFGVDAVDTAGEQVCELRACTLVTFGVACVRLLWVGVQ